MAAQERKVPPWQVAVVTITVASLFIAVLIVLVFYRAFAFVDELSLGIGTFIIGGFGAGVVVFGATVGLKGFEELPKRLFTPFNVAMYVLLGGGIAVLFWLPTPLTFAPLYSAGIGAAWPAAIQGLMTAVQSKDVADAQTEKIKKLLATIGE